MRADLPGGPDPARTVADVEFLWPVHPNPAIRPVVQRDDGGRCAGPPLRASRLRSVRRGHEARDIDPDRLRRHSGRGPRAGQAGAGAAARERAARGREARCALLVGHDPSRIVAETRRILASPPTARVADGKSLRRRPGGPRIVSAIAGFLGSAGPIRAGRLTGSPRAGLLALDLGKERRGLAAGGAR